MVEQEIKGSDPTSTHPPPRKRPSPATLKKDVKRLNLTEEDGPFASNAANNAPVWAMYGAQAKISDDQIFTVCDSALDSLLIFVSSTQIVGHKF
jgi:hypothetical protein